MGSKRRRKHFSSFRLLSYFISASFSAGHAHLQKAIKDEGKGKESDIIPTSATDLSITEIGASANKLPYSRLCHKLSTCPKILFAEMLGLKLDLLVGKQMGFCSP